MSERLKDVMLRLEKKFKFGGRVFDIEQRINFFQTNEQPVAIGQLLTALDLYRQSLNPNLQPSQLKLLVDEVKKNQSGVSYMDLPQLDTLSQWHLGYFDEKDPNKFIDNSTFHQNYPEKAKEFLRKYMEDVFISYFFSKRTDLSADKRQQLIIDLLDFLKVKRDTKDYYKKLSVEGWRNYQDGQVLSLFILLDQLRGEKENVFYGFEIFFRKGFDKAVDMKEEVLRLGVGEELKEFLRHRWIEVRKIEYRKPKGFSDVRIPEINIKAPVKEEDILLEDQILEEIISQRRKVLDDDDLYEKKFKERKKNRTLRIFDNYPDVYADGKELRDYPDYDKRVIEIFNSLEKDKNFFSFFKNRLRRLIILAFEKGEKARAMNNYFWESDFLNTGINNFLFNQLYRLYYQDIPDDKRLSKNYFLKIPGVIEAILSLRKRLMFELLLKQFKGRGFDILKTLKEDSLSEFQKDQKEPKIEPKESLIINPDQNLFLALTELVGYPYTSYQGPILLDLLFSRKKSDQDKALSNISFDDLRNFYFYFYFEKLFRFLIHKNKKSKGELFFFNKGQKKGIGCDFFNLLLDAINKRFSYSYLLRMIDIDSSATLENGLLRCGLKFLNIELGYLVFQEKSE